MCLHIYVLNVPVAMPGQICYSALPKNWTIQRGVQFMCSMHLTALTRAAKQSSDCTTGATDYTCLQQIRPPSRTAENTNTCALCSSAVACVLVRLCGDSGLQSYLSPQGERLVRLDSESLNMVLKPSQKRCLEAGGSSSCFLHDTYRLNCRK